MVARLFVGNLPYSATEQTLRELFGEVGTVREVVLPTDRETGRLRGFAFVEMATEAEATAAIHRFEGHVLDGRRLRVNRAEERAERGPRSSASSLARWASIWRRAIGMIRLSSSG